MPGPDLESIASDEVVSIPPINLLLKAKSELDKIPQYVEKTRGVEPGTFQVITFEEDGSEYRVFDFSSQIGRHLGIVKITRDRDKKTIESLDLIVGNSYSSVSFESFLVRETFDDGTSEIKAHWDPRKHTEGENMQRADEFLGNLFQPRVLQKAA